MQILAGTICSCFRIRFSLHILKQPARVPTDQPFFENGVYHTTTAANELELLNKEKAWCGRRIRAPKDRPDIRTRSRTKTFFRAIVFWEGLSSRCRWINPRSGWCEQRCLGLLDDMNNWAGPRYMIAEGDTYMKYPDDETFSAVSGEITQARPGPEV